MKFNPCITFGLKEFLIESNKIEGIYKSPSAEDLAQAEMFLQGVDIEALNKLQRSIAPGKPLRDKVGMNVRVGNFIPPAGGPLIVDDLTLILSNAHGFNSAWETHVRFEQLHPYMDGNGRTGRLLWAWAMKREGNNPFALPFLHRFYYQTLANVNM